MSDQINNSKSWYFEDFLEGIFKERKKKENLLAEFIKIKEKTQIREVSIDRGKIGNDNLIFFTGLCKYI